MEQHDGISQPGDQPIKRWSLENDYNRDKILRAIPRLKEELEIERSSSLVAPTGSSPSSRNGASEAPSSRARAPVTVRHYDLYSQTLAKLERGHARDLADVAAMLDRGLVDPTRLRELHAAVEPLLYRFPAVDPPTLRAALEAALEGR